MGTGAIVLTLPRVGEILQAPQLEDRPTYLKSVPQGKFTSKGSAASTDLTDGALGKTQVTVNLNVVAASEAEREAERKKRQDALAEAWAPPRIKKKQPVQPKTISPNFEDNPDVPPL